MIQIILKIVSESKKKYGGCPSIRFHLKSSLCWIWHVSTSPKISLFSTWQNAWILLNTRLPQISLTFTRNWCITTKAQLPDINTPSKINSEVYAFVISQSSGQASRIKNVFNSLPPPPFFCAPSMPNGGLFPFRFVRVSMQHFLWKLNKNSHWKFPLPSLLATRKREIIKIECFSIRKGPPVLRIIGAKKWYRPLSI